MNNISDWQANESLKTELKPIYGISREKGFTRKFKWDSFVANDTELIMYLRLIKPKAKCSKYLSRLSKLEVTCKNKWWKSYENSEK